MAEALLALGGNVGDVRATLDRAIAALCERGDIRLTARSSDYETPPWGVADQPPFINLCIAVETALAPLALLARTQEVERAFGRDRAHERRWGPRSLDIDLLAYDDLALDTPDLTLPHPRLFERAFVLVPLAEIVPDRVIAGRRVARRAGARRRGRHRETAAAADPPRRLARRLHACKPGMHAVTMADASTRPPAGSRISRGHRAAMAQAGRRRAQGRAVREAAGLPDL